MMKTLEFMGEAIRNPKHPFRKTDNQHHTSAASVESLFADCAQQRLKLNLSALFVHVALWCSDEEHKK